MPLSTTITYDTAGNFNFSDEDKINIISSKLALKLLVYANELAFADYGASADLRRATGSATATLSGNATLSGGKIDMGSGGHIDYVATGNADSSQTGCFRFDLYPQYTGNPSGKQYLIVNSKQSASTINLIELAHATSGSLDLKVRDSSNVQQISASLGSWSPTAGTRYTFELNYDFTSGATRLFINGAQQGSTITTTLTRDSNITLLRFGAADTTAGTADSNFELDFVRVFSSVQHTSNHTGEIPFAEPTDYTPDAQTALVDSTTGMQSITNITANTGGTGTIKYRIRFGSTDYYISGGVLVASDGTIAQSSTLAELQAALPIDINPDSNVQLRAVLQSSDGYATPTITDVTIAYNKFATQTSLSKCVIEGYVTDNGTVVEGAIVTIRSTTAGLFHTGNSSISVNLTQTTESNGYYAIEVQETATANVKLDVKITYTDALGVAQEDRFKILVPNQASATMKEARDLAA